MAHLSIDVLGPLQVSMAGKPVTGLESVKVRALLAYLAIESGQSHSRGTLVGLLWPEFTEDSARHNLRQALFNLRSALGDPANHPPFLRITRDTIQFDRASDYELDLDRFNRYDSLSEADLPQSIDDNTDRIANLEAMVKLYRGEFLQQLALDDSSEFEDWLLVQRENLHQRVLEAHSYLANSYELQADFQSARRHATRQLELDPWREEAYRQLMRALALEGQRSAALAQYETCKRILAEELDVEPSAETRQLYDQIRLGNFGAERNPPPGPVSVPVNQLPVQLTPFIGRQAELGQLGEFLSDPECRCITLVGPGGIGKTRLALQIAATYAGNYADAAAFVPFAPVGSVAGVVPAIMSALNISIYGQSDPKTYLLGYLRTKQMLLILDNVEQLLIEDLHQSSIIQLIIEILKSTSGVKLLVTSREALNLQGELIFDVLGLGFPATDDIEQSGTFDAISLFVQRARRAAPQFTLTAENQATIAHICRLVEGMPLALELAATWSRHLSLAEIASEIEHSLDFLSSSVRDLPERHQSMRVVFDHSWQMLSKDEQLVLAKLAVFRGGFQRQAAEQVAGATLSILSTLVNRSLLRRTAVGRYDLHELVWQYCSDQLKLDQNVKKATEERHYDYYFALVKASEQELHGASQLEWLEKLELEHDNLRIAFEWALEGDNASLGAAERALQLAAALRWFWRMHGHFREGCDWLSEALQESHEAKSNARASALLGVALLINGLGDLRACLPPVEEAIKIYEELHDQPGLAEAWLVEGLTYLWQGDASQGNARLEEALVIYRATGDRWGEAHALYRLGSYVSDYGGDPAGRRMLEESAAILEKLGDEYLRTSVLISMGIIDLGRGEYDSALDLLERSLSTTRAIQHPWGIADSLTNLGCLYRIRGEYSKAQSYFEEALDVYQKPASSIWQTDVYCALAENALCQGDFSNSRQYLQAAISILGSSENKWLQVLVWYFRGLLAFYQGELSEAARLLEEDIPFERHGQYKPDLARSLVTLGRVRLQLGEVGRAGELIHEGLALFNEIGHKLGMVTALEALAETHVIKQDHNQAVRLLAAAHGKRQVLRTPLPPIERMVHDSMLEKCRAILGEGLFSTTWEAALVAPFEGVVLEGLNSATGG